MNSDLELIMVVTVLLLIPIIGGIVGRNHEKKKYNNGICRECGYPLRHFDTDSQGGRGYICDACKYSCWVSYNVDKKHKVSEENNNGN